jgi:hypothetical protein
MTRFGNVEIDFVADDRPRCCIVITRIIRTKASWAGDVSVIAHPFSGHAIHRP